jgi:nucleotidyltransferase/DNA polymerase involved in DNA repair
MDAFFAAVEQRDQPVLAGKPVIVGADPKKGKGRGVVSTCSYQARKFGIHSAMPISLAFRKCPQAFFLPVNMPKYRKVSSQIYEILGDFSPKIEIVSIDEAFLDISGSFHIFGSPLKTCQLIKSKIKEKTKLTASLGLGPTKMAAKIASDLDKPDGLVEVKEDKLLDFLWGLDLEKLWGLGKVSKLVLNNLGIKTIGDLAQADLKLLKHTLGKNGEYFKLLAQGIDSSQVEESEVIKSISNETTFSQDSLDMNLVESTLISLCEKVSGRLRNQDLKGRTITLKIRLEGFKTYTRSSSLIKATSFTDTIYKAIKKLLGDFSLNRRKIRLLGVKVSNLISKDTLDSFLESRKDKKLERMHKAIDKIQEKFGQDSLYRAGNIQFFDKL